MTYEIKEVFKIIPIFFLLIAVLICGFIDYKTYKIPNDITLPMVVTGIGYHIYLGNIKFMLVGFIISFAIGFFCWILGGFGAGDLKLMTGIGVWLGAFSFLQILFLSCLIALIWVIADYRKQNKGNKELLKKIFNEIKYLLLFGFSKIQDNKSDLAKPIPFGACLSLATTVVVTIYII
ncbi:MAG: A24 family peptidase [Clostridia bacterium]|nr:A24 family peptidase [Clostridia bacterium]